MTTGRADEAARPSQPFQVVQAVCISREPSLKFSKRLRVVGADTGAFHCHSVRATPVKWIPQRVILTRVIACTPRARDRRSGNITFAAPCNDAWQFRCLLVLRP